MKTEEQAAYEAGYDAGKNGPNTVNSHFCYFATKELSDEWSRGNKYGIAARQRIDRLKDLSKKRV